MSFGKMNTPIKIVRTVSEKDSDGFKGRETDIVLAEGRAYCEEKRGTEFWASKVAVFAKAAALFQLRRVPGLTIDTSMTIIAHGRRYNILHAPPPGGRGMYVELLCERVELSKGGA